MVYAKLLGVLNPGTYYIDGMYVTSPQEKLQVLSVWTSLGINVVHMLLHFHSRGKGTFCVISPGGREHKENQTWIPLGYICVFFTLMIQLCILPTLLS